VKSIKTSPTKVAFKTNNVRIAHNTSPTKAAAVLKKKMKTKKKTTATENNRSRSGFSILKEEKPSPISGLCL